MSEKRFLGWEPTEIHAHEYDDAGRIVRTTVTREPEWDDNQRNLMLALAQFEAESCRGCGYHESLTDPANGHTFTPESRICTVCAGADQYARRQSADDEAADKNLSDQAPPETPRPRDGRSTFMRPMSPDEVAAATRGASPT